MSIFVRLRNKVRALTQLRGTTAMKRALWNKEFGAGHWNHITDRSRDFIHDVLDRYLGNGSILDLACGAGAIGIELDQHCYKSYTGVDISDVALGQARAAADRAGRGSRNEYIQGDIEHFLPSRNVDVILMSECLCYVPKGRVAPLLLRLSTRLTPRGVIVIRLFDRNRYPDHIRVVRATMTIVEEIDDPGSTAIILVCRPQQ